MLNSETRDDVLVVRLGESRLDAARAPAFKNEMADLIGGGHDRVVLDLSQVQFMDSSGVGALVSVLKKLGPRGTLAVAGAQGVVRKLFTLTRMDRVFPMHEGVDEAVAQITG